MNKISSDEKKAFIVVIILCAIITITLVLMSLKSNFEKMTIVGEYNTFFSVVNEVNKYLSYSSSGDNDALYELLDERFIKDNDVNINNVLFKIKTYSEGVSVKAKKVSSLKIGNNNVYLLEGSIVSNYFDESNMIVDDNFKIIVLMDFNNVTASIYPILNDNYKKAINSINKIEIPVNEYNSISSSSLVNKEQVCVLYLSDFVNLLNRDLSSSYELLSDDMKKNIDYSTYDRYYNYLSSNKNLITTVADKCAVEDIKGKRVYTVVDMNNNIYKFTEESIMNYKVDFTLYSDKKEEDNKNS